jgi:hypothetical protein
MRRFFLTVVLAGLVALALPFAASALGLDLEANAGAGLGMGYTTNPDETGSPRQVLQGGLEADLFLFKAGPVDLGISTGLEYDNMSNHGTTIEPSYPPPNTQTIDSDNTYVYLVVPFALSSRIPLTKSMTLSLRVGGFYGFFMGGQSYNVTSNLYGSLPSTNLSSITPAGLLGIHFSGGLDFPLAQKLFLSPSLIFNMGLTNTTGTSMTNYTFWNGSTYTDSLWSLSLMIGLKYSVL